MLRSQLALGALLLMVACKDKDTDAVEDGTISDTTPADEAWSLSVSGPESGVYDPVSLTVSLARPEAPASESEMSAQDLVALAARSGQTWRPEHWAPYRPKEEAADAGRASWSSVYAARRGSADSGDSFDARSAGAGKRPFAQS